MTVSREQLVSRVLLAGILALNFAGLWPELTISRLDLNDNALHYPLIQGMVDAVEHGRSPLDWWANEWSLGYPVLRTYQPLAHTLVAAAYFALGKTVSLMTVFVWVRLLSVALLPLSFFACARQLGFRPLTAAAAALLSPLVSTNALYGLEYGSYLWAGSGLFTQAVAAHFLLITIGVGYRAIRGGRRIALTGILLGLTFLAHFIYGYMAGVTLALLAALPAETPFAARVRRLAAAGSVAFIAIAFELVPMLLDGSLVNRSRWEYAWKWDSFGAPQVLKWTFTGELLDHNRLPVLSLLSLLGAGVFCFSLRGGPRRPARVFVAAGAALWILMLFGRPFWGPALLLLGALPSLQLHRVIGGVHVFLIFLAAIGLAALWRTLTRRVHAIAAVAVTAVILYPALKERRTYLANNSLWGTRSLAAYTANQQSVDAALAIAQQRGGRAYAGLAAAWGGSFKIGDLPFYAYLSRSRIQALSFMYHSMSVTSDIMTRFNEWSPAHYALFNVRTVIAPVQGPALPDFLKLQTQTGLLRVYEAPGPGNFDVVDVLYGARVTQDNFYDVADRWLQSDWVAKKQHLALALDRDIPSTVTRLSPDDALPQAPALPPAGTIRSEQQNGQDYGAAADVDRASYVLLKTTWHPNWKAYVDGNPRNTIMISPGFIGVPVEAGRHQISLRYEPETWKAFLLCAGLFVPLLLVWAEQRGWAMFKLVGQALTPAKGRWITAAGIVALSLPVCVPLATSRLPGGHDALEYLPRMVEFDQNITHGIWLPRWAPDLSNGAGQPLFLFNPPMFYYIAEAWHLTGFDFVRSMNLACIALVLASAAGMFLLGKLYFGEAGGWLAAAAYIYAPYFAVDLYVRSALAEFSAFPFFAFSLYGFGAFAQSRERRHFLTGAAAYAGVLLSHNPAALLFTPLLAGFTLFTAWRAWSWKLAMQQASGIALGLALSAFVWLPSLAQREYVRLESLLEGYLRYSNHFVYLRQLFSAQWGYGLSVIGDHDDLSFSLGWEHLLLAACALVAAILARRARVTIFFAISGGVLALFMLSVAQPLWDRVTLLEYIEFPWRMLGPVSVCVALVVASLGQLKWRRRAYAAVLALLIVPNLAHLHPREFRSIDTALWKPGDIAAKGIGVDTADEYRPRWMPASPGFRRQKAVFTSGAAELAGESGTPVWWGGIAKVRTPATVQLLISYFPGWRVEVDHRATAANPQQNTGLIEFQLPPGEHFVSAAWGRTPATLAGDVVSSAALLLVFALLLAPARKRVFAETTNIAGDLTRERRSAAHPAH